MCTLSCTGKASNGGSAMGCDTSAYTEEVYRPSHSKNFEILANPADGSTLLRVANPWQSADEIICSAIIRGDESEGQTAEIHEDTTILPTAAKRIVAMSSTYVAMLDAIGASDRIVGVSGIDFIACPSIAGRKDEIADVGNEQNVDFEKLVSVGPDLVLIYGVNGRSAMEPKLRELKIPFLYIGDYVEQSPLGRAEWIVALGHLVGERERAARYFEDVAQRYQSLRERADQQADRPKVMINAPYGDNWFMPSSDSYMVRLISDAGGEYLYNSLQGNSSKPIDLEEAYLLASEADYWLNPGRIATYSEMKAQLPRFANLPVVQKGLVYNNNARATAGGGNDFYESGAVNPDLILRDLISIFHPGLTADESTYYQPLKQK